MKTTLAQVVQEGRRSAGMSQAVLAAACGVSERTVIRIEGGERPSPETLMALCSVLRISPEAARAAIPAEGGAKGGPVLAIPEFGPKTQAIRLKGATIATAPNPTATHVAAGDVTWGLQTPLGRKWLRQKGAEGRPMRNEDDFNAALDAGEGALSKGLRKVLVPARKKMGAALNVLVAIVVTVTCLSLALGYLWLAAKYEREMPWVARTTTLAIIIAVAYATARVLLKELTDEKVGNAFLTAMAASPDMVSFAKGESLVTFEAARCRSVSIDVEPDGAHMTVRVTDRNGERRTARWLPADQGLRATLEAFRAKAEAAGRRSPEDTPAQTAAA